LKKKDDYEIGRRREDEIIVKDIEMKEDKYLMQYTIDDDVLSYIKIANSVYINIK